MIMETVHLYGIPNCGSVKRAIEYFTLQQLPYLLHDFKVEPPTEELIRNWVAQDADHKILNKHSTTWRELSEEDKANLDDPQTIIDLLLKHPLLIKRPIVVQNRKVLAIGFDLEKFNATFLFSK